MSLSIQQLAPGAGSGRVYVFIFGHSNDADFANKDSANAETALRVVSLTTAPYVGIIDVPTASGFMS
jgi:hypothetical protein